MDMRCRSASGDPAPALLAPYGQTVHGDVSDEGNGSATFRIGFAVITLAFRVSPRAIPTAVEIPVPAWPALSKSNGDSLGSRRPPSPVAEGSTVGSVR